MRIIEKINDEIMTEFSNSRLELEKQTQSGQDSLMIENWKKQVDLKLKELDEFRYENTKKIKLK